VALDEEKKITAVILDSSGHPKTHQALKGSLYGPQPLVGEETGNLVEESS
jgi:hypothetical protein